MSKRDDVIFYWVGGREKGAWRSCPAKFAGRSIDERVADLKRLGHVAKRGSTTIGPPDGPPSDADFSSLGL